MRFERLAVGMLVSLAACGRHEPAQAPMNKAQSPAAPAPVEAVDNGSAPAQAGPGVPSTQRTLAEPNGPIDPKSAEAAGQVVQHYLASIEQGQWTRSRAYWSDANSAKAFERSFRDDADVHAEIGELGPMEGAAGSIYLTEPVTFYGKTNAGDAYRRKAEVVLRRVNDVPGSTASQRRWHIERIDWKDAP